MTLANYKAPSREMVLGDTSIHLVGLSLEHITILVREHLSDLEAIVEIISGGESLDQIQDFKNVAFSLVTQAPGLAANIIAIAANEPDQAEAVMRIPAPTQIEILLAIGDLTFMEVGGIKKAMGSVAGLLGAMDTKLKAKMAAKKQVRAE